MGEWERVGGEWEESASGLARRGSSGLASGRGRRERERVKGRGKVVGAARRRRVRCKDEVRGTGFARRRRSEAPHPVVGGP